MENEKQEKLKKIIGKVSVGNVTAIGFNKELSKKALFLTLEQNPKVKIVIPEDEADIEKIDLNSYIGAKLKFEVTGVLENGALIGSRTKIRMAQRKLILDKLQEGEVLNAKVFEFRSYGAIVLVNGTERATIKNVDWAADCTNINEIHKIGDVIKVKFLKVNQNNKIQLQAAERYCAEGTPTIDDFEEAVTTKGVIKGIKPDFLFVRIGKNVDVLCPIPPSLEVEEDMQVAVYISKIMEQEINGEMVKRVRGKILRVIEKDSFVIDESI